MTKVRKKPEVIVGLESPEGLSVPASKKYTAVIHPTRLIIGKTGQEIDMRTMTLKEADTLFEFRPNKYLKLKKNTDDSQ